jgi:hypothetical protein
MVYCTVLLTFNDFRHYIEKLLGMRHEDVENLSVSSILSSTSSSTPSAQSGHSLLCLTNQSTRVYYPRHVLHPILNSSSTPSDQSGTLGNSFASS